MKERSSNDSSGATRQVLAGVCIAAALCTVGVLHVASKVSAVESGYQLGQLEDAHRTLEREHATLLLQLATMRSAAHIETTARTRLGMTAPAPQRVFAMGGPVSPLVNAAPKKRNIRKGGVVGPSGVPVAMLAPVH
jgi:cell division protein FtsL